MFIRCRYGSSPPGILRRGANSPQRFSLGIRRIVRATAFTMNQQAMNLIFLGVQQDRATMTACIIDRILAGLEYRWSIQNVAGCWRDDDF